MSLLRAPAATARRGGVGRTAGAEIAPHRRSEIAAPATGAAVEHGQRRVEAQHHFGRIFFDAALSVHFGSAPTFDVTLAPFFQILLGDLAQAFAEDTTGTGLSSRCRSPSRQVSDVDPQIGDRPPILVLDFWIGPGANQMTLFTPAIALPSWNSL